MALPVPAHHVLMFIAFCFHDGKAAATVISYVSAISYHHKIRLLPDPTQTFLVKKCLMGYQKTRPTTNARLLITPHILGNCVHLL